MKTVDDEIVLENKELVALGELKSYIAESRNLVTNRDVYRKKYIGNDTILVVFNEFFYRKLEFNHKILMLLIEFDKGPLCELYDKYISEDKFLPVDVRDIEVRIDDCKSISICLNRLENFYKYAEDLI